MSRQSPTARDAAWGRRRCLGAVALVTLLAAGCYTYTPLATATPASGTQVALVLSDQGRVQAAPSVGPHVARVEGALVDATDADYVVQVSDVIDIQGRRTKWTGETVPLPRAAVANSFEKRFSRSRTYLLVGGVTAAFVAVAVSQDLLGLGGGSEGGSMPPPYDQ